MGWTPASAADVAIIVLALSVPSGLVVLAILARGYEVRLRITRPVAGRRPTGNRTPLEVDTPDDTPEAGHDPGSST